MNSKLAEIITELNETRSFNDESYLPITQYVIFLLFGCNDEQCNLLKTRANKIIADRQAYALIRVENSDDIIKSVGYTIDTASKEHMVRDLNQVHICPVIMSESASSSDYLSIIKGIDSYLTGRTIGVEWKPFLILNTLASNASKWLDTVSNTIRELGTHKSCRCCVLTTRNEANIEVAEERLLTTVLFVAFLNVVEGTRTNIGIHIAYQEQSPDLLFYTAQTAFIENPIVSRILRRMTGLLSCLNDGIPSAQSVDMGFMQDILNINYSKMPHDEGAISLTPIYSVMPSDGPDFSKRLKDFVDTYYLAYSFTEVQKEEMFSDIASKFLQAHIRAGKGADDLKLIIGNDTEIEKLSRVQMRGVSISDFPDYPLKGKFISETVEQYEKCANWLRKQIINMGTNILQEFFHSSAFSSLPEKYNNVVNILSDNISEMKHLLRKCSELDVILPLLDDPDEKWLEEKVKDPNTISIYVKSFSSLALSESPEEFNDELSTLFEKLYQISKGLSGGRSARAYMDLVSETCEDINNTAALTCMDRIKDALEFPINKGIGSDSYTYVWGSGQNKLYDVWAAHHKMISTGNLLLPLKSNERFGVLRVSDGFKREDILRVSGRTM